MDTNTILIIILIAVIIIVALQIFLSFKAKAGSSKEELEKQEERSEMMRDEILIMKEYVKHLKEELRDTAKVIDNKLHENNRDVQQSLKFQFTESQKLIKDITEELTEVKEGNKQVFSMTEQLTNLEKVLTNQKQRGNWGEASLELILSNVINGSYAMQHYFKNGEAVDAVVYIKDKLLPIDSKFSLDNYQRCIDSDDEDDKKFFAEEFKKDLKLRITETAKYIRESENTLPIAFMFIPSEAIYYDLLAGENSRIKVNTQKLIEYAQLQKVFIVSPTSILAYLHLVLSGIKAFSIEENAKQIQKKVEELGKHIESYEEYYKKLGNTLSTTVNHYNNGYKELKKIDKDVYKITEGVSGGNVEILAIEKPNINNED